VIRGPVGPVKSLDACRANLRVVRLGNPISDWNGFRSLLNMLSRASLLAAVVGANRWLVEHELRSLADTDRRGPGPDP